MIEIDTLMTQRNPLCKAKTHGLCNNIEIAFNFELYPPCVYLQIRNYFFKAAHRPLCFIFSQWFHIHTIVTFISINFIRWRAWWTKCSKLDEALALIRRDKWWKSIWN